ncbi:MAG: PH domain-containing protein [Micrococcales bacterium]|nr:PH domain-containing protein [Micrococcales bacterium]
MPERNLDHLERYLLKGEHIVVAVHRHWATVAEPVALAVVGLALASWLSATVHGRGAAFGDLGWWLSFALLGRALFYLWEWRREWFIATDRRLLLIYGFIVRKVDMMPLGKVTDMTYHRSVAGRLLGYGTFVLESAGQDQALSRLYFIPKPDATYKSIIAQIFHRKGDEAVDSQTDDYAAEIMQEEDPTRRRTFAEHLRRIAGRPAFATTMNGPVQETPRKSRKKRHGDRREPRRQPGRGAAVAAPDDDDTASMDLGGLGSEPEDGETIYRSRDADGTDSPFYDAPREDPSGWWRPN